jgi:hypothetical protein
LPPATFAKSPEKQESQLRMDTESRPSRSEAWLTLVQKQVGHTSVQFAQARQRSAIFAHCGSSRRAINRPGSPSTATGSPIASRTAATAARPSPTRSSPAGVSGRRSNSARPAGVAARTRNPSSSSVRTRSASSPGISGPVPIDVQKQVAPATVHSTATTSAARRRAA